jgi:hypothetical protein
VRTCTPTTQDCDCPEPDVATSDNPLCQDATTGAYSTKQWRAKGYPGIRELSVLKGLNDQGIVASVCPADIDDPLAANYGYTPAIGAIVDRLKSKLSGDCLTRPLSPDKEGQVTCIVIEARQGDGGACCAGAARRDVESRYSEALAQAQEDPAAKGDDCFCEVDQLQGAALHTCQTDTDVVPVGAGGTPVDGWCYVDDNTGAAALLDGCAAGERYKLRFVGAGQPQKGATTFVTCAGGS